MQCLVIILSDPVKLKRRVVSTAHRLNAKILNRRLFIFDESKARVFSMIFERLRARTLMLLVKNVEDSEPEENEFLHVLILRLHDTSMYRTLLVKAIKRHSFTIDSINLDNMFTVFIPSGKHYREFMEFELSGILRQIEILYRFVAKPLRNIDSRYLASIVQVFSMRYRSSMLKVGIDVEEFKNVWSKFYA